MRREDVGSYGDIRGWKEAWVLIGTCNFPLPQPWDPDSLPNTTNLLNMSRMILILLSQSYFLLFLSILLANQALMNTLLEPKVMFILSPSLILCHDQHLRFF